MFRVREPFRRLARLKVSFSPQAASIRSFNWLPVFVFTLAWRGGDHLLGAETRFTIVDSSPSSWVARGYRDYTVGPTTGWTVTVVTSNRPLDRFLWLQFQGSPLPSTDVNYWSLVFAAPNDAMVAPGHYADYERWPFQRSTRPGLEFIGGSRQDNGATGFFDVYDATYGPDGSLASFAADFTHHGEPYPDGWAIVQVRYNSNVPEPNTFWAVLAGIILLFRRPSNVNPRYAAASVSSPQTMLPNHHATNLRTVKGEDR